MEARSPHGIGKFLASSKVLFFVSLFILIFFSVNLTKEVINRKDLQQDVDKLEAEINGLESRNKELSDLIGYFKSLDFVEEEARTKLNLRKPGENIIIVPEEAGVIAGTNQDYSTILEAEVEILSNAQKWWNYFFKIVYDAS